MYSPQQGARAICLPATATVEPVPMPLNENAPCGSDPAKVVGIARDAQFFDERNLNPTELRCLSLAGASPSGAESRAAPSRAAPPPAPPPELDIQRPRTALETTLEQYRTALVNYKLSGNSALRQQVDSYKQWLDTYVQSLQKQGQDQANSIQQFVSSYQATNPELVEMQRQLKVIQEEGPKLQDQYETEQRAQEEEPTDFTPYYVKGGLIAGVAALLGVLSFF